MLPSCVSVVPFSRSYCFVDLVVELLLHCDLLPPIDSPLVKRILFPAGREAVPGMFSRVVRPLAPSSCMVAAKYIIVAEMLLFIGLLPPNVSSLVR